MTDCIVFWQRMLTPHMTELARQLALAGVEVHYVCEEVLSAERRAMGWRAGELSRVVTHTLTTPKEARLLVDRLPVAAVHVTQGIRANGLIAHAQRKIAERGLRHYPVMEMVDLRGMGRWIKPFLYALRLRMLSGSIEGLLAIGERTPDWLVKQAPRGGRVIPFAYFLASRRQPAKTADAQSFRFVFVGALIKRKRVDLLLEALSGIRSRPFEIEIVGDGPERSLLERQASSLLPGRVSFRGTLDMETAIDRLAEADCLVLPSDHDGWGAVVSEALINGTPAICSDACGASEVVKASARGAVFAAGDPESLSQCLSAALDGGRVDTVGRNSLSEWAKCLTAESGARYLLHIVGRDGHKDEPIIPPWRAGDLEPGGGR